jgi:hypothetical protein
MQLGGMVARYRNGYLVPGGVSALSRRSFGDRKRLHLELNPHPII